MAVTVELDDLRVGMFVHLDVGWMSHPFPLSSFKITSPDQIATIRGLGLKKLRSSPDRSDVLLVATPQITERLVGPDLTAVEMTAQPVDMSPTERAQQERTRQLAEQTEALRLCERQYGEACRDLRRVNDAVVGEPQQARESVQQLTQALLDKMLVDEEQSWFWTHEWQKGEQEVNEAIKKGETRTFKNMGDMRRHFEK